LHYKTNKTTSRDLCKKALPSTAETQTQIFGCFRPKYLLILPKSPINSPWIPDNQASGPPFRQQQVQTHRLQMALHTHFNQPEIGCPGVAEFTVQRTEALFDHITGLRQIAVTFGLLFRQRTVAA